MVVHIVEDALDQALMLPRQPPIQEGNGVPFVAAKRLRLIGSVMPNCVCGNHVCVLPVAYFLTPDMLTAFAPPEAGSVKAGRRYSHGR
jgi:hypothetical protein